MKLDFEAPKLRIERFCDENIVTSSVGGLSAGDKIKQSGTFGGMSADHIHEDDWGSMTAAF